MDTEDALDIISEIASQLKLIASINCGGCGIAALSIYRALKKKMPDINWPETFLYDDRPDWPIDLAPSHILYMANDWKIDSHGVTLKLARDNGPVVNEKQLLVCINNVEFNWNPTFDREKYVPVIEIMLGIDLSDVKKEVMG